MGSTPAFNWKTLLPVILRCYLEFHPITPEDFTAVIVFSYPIKFPHFQIRKGVLLREVLMTGKNPNNIVKHSGSKRN
ncbi:MAG: hypothetical protein IPN13_14200 [Bacteroidetes bacterium]|nr:hypothetical protein [Bacteroidota bacterium]